MKKNLLIWFADLDPDSPDSVGTQRKQVAKLTHAKFPILPGFIITSDAYFAFLEENNLDYKIKQLLSTIAIDRPDSLMQGEHHIKQLFAQAKLSEELTTELTNFYQHLGENEITLSLHEKDPQGRKHITLQAYNADKLVEQVKNAWTEMFTGNALWHRHHQHLDHLQTGAEIIVQAKIHGDQTGTVTTIDPDSHEKDKLVIITTNPHEGDHYILSKKNLSIIDRKLKHTTNLPKLSHDEILAIAKMAKRLEEYLYFPQEISWVIDEKSVYIIETKPVSTVLKNISEKKRKLPIARGKSITPMIGTGVINIISKPTDLQKVKPHDVLIISSLTVKQIPHLKKARAIIVESNSFPVEIAVLLKQYGIPAIGNVKHPTKLFRNGHIITIHGGKGEIYLGGIL